MIRIQEQIDGHIELLIPIGIESLFYYARCVCLFRVDGDDCERVGKAEDKVGVRFGHLNGENEDGRPVILIFLLCKQG